MKKRRKARIIGGTICILLLGVYVFLHTKPLLSGEYEDVVGIQVYSVTEDEWAECDEATTKELYQLLSSVHCRIRKDTTDDPSFRGSGAFRIIIEYSDGTTDDVGIAENTKYAYRFISDVEEVYLIGRNKDVFLMVKGILGQEVRTHG